VYINPILLTIQVAILATTINTPIALFISWLLVKKRVPGRIFIEALISLPLALPPVAIGFGLLYLFGRNGPIGAFLEFTLGMEIFFTWVAAVFAAAVVSFPLMVRAIMVAMGEINPQLEESARSLGAGPLRVAMTITIPLAYRGILAGLLLGFVRALSEFGATIVVAGNIPGKTQTISLAIYQNVQIGNTETALVFVGVSILLASLSLIIHNWLLQRKGPRGT
jgi:molybdate transport system permease protein